MQASVEEAVSVIEGHDLTAMVWKFTEMLESETLPAHVSRMQAKPEDERVGPFLASSLAWRSKRCLGWMGATSMVSDRDRCAAQHQLHNAFATQQDWFTHINTISSGSFSPVFVRVVTPDRGAGLKSFVVHSFIQPIILTSAVKDGKVARFWGAVMQFMQPDQDSLADWGLRDLLTARFTPACISALDAETGNLLWQNSASMALYGCRGLIHFQNPLQPSGRGYSPPPAEDSGVPFLRRLFFSAPDIESALQEIQEGVLLGGTYRTELEILEPGLRSWMGLVESKEMFYDVQICSSFDPAAKRHVLFITQINITDRVLSERQLLAEKARASDLLQKQHKLIACLKWVSDVSSSLAPSPTNSEHLKLIDSVRRKLLSPDPASNVSSCSRRTSSGSGAQRSDPEEDLGSIQLLRLIGRGSFGMVYKGVWQGRDVAVKQMMLPICLSGSEAEERMAIMEAAISTCLSHPNIVTTYTYSLTPVFDTESSGLTFVRGGGAPGTMAAGTLLSRALPSDAADTPSKAVVAFKVDIVFEYCDSNTLQYALSRGAFLSDDGRPDFPAVLATALDIARGVAHLHANSIIHSDLKATNVLLTTDTTDICRGVTAKICDFGLSVKLDASALHMSGHFMGTMTHAAPEVLLHGHQSWASDAYSYGILLWELYVGERPYEKMGYAVAVLGHQITAKQLRPVFPAHAPETYAELAEMCWHESPDCRPNFEEILHVLAALIASSSSSGGKLKQKGVPRS